jgi:hypothetical protein
MAYLGQQRFVAPGSIRYQVMERLVHPLHVVGSEFGSHRLDALTFQWKQ